MHEYKDIKRLRLQDSSEMQRKRALMREALEDKMYKKFGYRLTKILNLEIKKLMYEDDE